MHVLLCDLFDEVVKDLNSFSGILIDTQTTRMRATWVVLRTTEYYSSTNVS